MFTRLHISSFIAFTIFIWLIVLWIQGVPVLSLEFIKPFSLVVGVIMLFFTIFNRHAWSWKIFKGWYVNRPDLRGTWELELNSNWLDPNTQAVKESILAYAVIRQTLTTLSVRVMTKESKSKLIAHSIEKEGDGVFKLIAVYRNEPKIELQGDRSEIHHGSFSVEIHGAPVTLLSGHYWTDRGTKGSMKFHNRRKEVFNTYEEARSVYNANPSKEKQYTRK
ncbi:hypothetical protein [Cysteiniphilum sp. 6C5]|uniref:Cap15 family cyclic dinucleotide receptor domain-containing protein n=1 Tax=unclassified Cysteiniphilum TaxID=2610889 RepID=UPI003F84E07B